MAVKTVSQLTSKELKTLSKRKVNPLFELTEKNKKTKEKQTKKSVQNSKNINPLKAKPKRVRKRKTNFKNDQSSSIVVSKSNNLRQKSTNSLKILYNKNAYSKLDELYENLTSIKIKKSKKDKNNFIENSLHVKSTGQCIALHEDDNSEYFHKIGKLIEGNLAKRKAYATGYFLYELFQ